ncbi:MAG: hypothetical protein WA101_01785 [Minisyncoccia bacterium]
MKQASLKLKSYTRSVDIVNNDNINRRMLNMMLWFLAFLALCYVLFLGNMIFSIVERKTLEADARSLSNEIGDLELQYLSASNKVDLALAESMGFKEIKAKFATRKTLGSIKFANNEL